MKSLHRRSRTNRHSRESGIPSTSNASGSPLTTAGMTINWVSIIFFAALTFASPAVAAPAQAGGVEHAAAPQATPKPAAKAGKEGEMEEVIKGKNREKLVIGKLDPPAAFNLEDIQNFPEDRLQPLLNAPVTFNEGRDFSTLMDFKEDQPFHPWLPEIAKGPFLQMKSPAIDKSSKDWDF